MTIGTLRGQIVNADAHDEMRRKGIKYDQLRDLLGKVQFTYLIQREGGFDGVQDWMDVLSGGEKQRIAVSGLRTLTIMEICLPAGLTVLPQTSICDSRWMHQCCLRECRGIHVRVLSNGESSFSPLPYVTLQIQVGITLFTMWHRKRLWK